MAEKDTYKPMKAQQDKTSEESSSSTSIKDNSKENKKEDKVEKKIVKPKTDKTGQASESNDTSPSSQDLKVNKEDKKPVKSEKKPKEDRIGILNIYTSFNNTLMNLTDLSGKSIAKFSGGQSTKQDRLKANPTIAMFVAQKVAEEAKDNGLTGFYVKIRAQTGQNNPGPGAHAAIKSLTRAGFRILSIMDTTKIPRGGPKKKGGRRGRRP